MEIDQFARAFAEWDRRFREDPAGFERDFERILRGETEDEYGAVCAVYFAELLEAVG